MPSWTLPNGLRVVFHPLPGRRTACVGVVLRIGSRDERGGEEGAAHLVEHLAFRDTARYAAAEITDLRERLGGGFEASTEKEFTSFTATVPAEGAWRALDLLASQVREPLFRAEDVAREQRIVLQELAEAQEDFEDRCAVLAEELLFGGALGREIAGSRRSVLALDRPAVRRFHRRAYAPEAAVVVAVGDLDRRRLMRDVERLFGTWRGSAPRRTAPPALPPRPVGRVLWRRSPSAQVVAAFPAITAEAGERALQTQALLSAMLGGTEGSRLFRAIRDHAALAYNVETYTSIYTDAAAFAVAFGVAGGRVGRALEIALHEIREICTEPGVEEHQRAVESLGARIELETESPWVIARDEARAALLGRAAPTTSDRLAMLRSISLAEVAAMGRRIFGSRGMALSIVGAPRLQAPQRWIRARLGELTWEE